ncbi:SRPBCC family protein [Raineyella sp. LH-20]|uniref:SRPBCC family protein n=1 Tax=Raineyella sp. LH-20 TaxID=3081204 RepID=UPI002954223E|nr:SRPBCC family protein [Raineyella sp. LH-20]WOP18870.1 SRPBCC family protein [Raineyella sp. LH-20]
MTDPLLPSRHVSVWIHRPADVVYAYAADPRHLPAWAAGLAGATIEPDGDAWATDSPMGRVRIAYVRRNDLGVLDHVVTVPSGESFYNPMRVVPGEAAQPDICEVVFTVRRRPGMTDESYASDVLAVAADLVTLKERLERD